MTDASSRGRRASDAAGRPRAVSSGDGLGLPDDQAEGDRLAGYVAAFLSGIRLGAHRRDHFRWTPAYAEQALALCDRTERLGMPAAWLVVELCCAGRKPLPFEDAVATVEAICQPPGLPVPGDDRPR